MRFWSEFIWLLRRLETVKRGLIDRIVTAINNEATARQNNDATLQTNIDNEADTRAAADTTLQNNIDAKRVFIQTGTPPEDQPIAKDSIWFQTVS